MMARSGKNACHQRPARTCQHRVNSQMPHVELFCNTAPMKVRDASKIIASATSVTVKTMMEQCSYEEHKPNRIHGALAPETMAALTAIFCRASGYDVCTNNASNLWRVHKANSKDIEERCYPGIETKTAARVRLQTI